MQGPTNERRVLLFTGHALSLGQQIVIDIQGRPHDACSAASASLYLSSKTLNVILIPQLREKNLGPFLPSPKDSRRILAVVPNRHSDPAIAGSFVRKAQFSYCGANP